MRLRSSVGDRCPIRISPYLLAPYIDSFPKRSLQEIILTPRRAWSRPTLSHSQPAHWGCHSLEKCFAFLSLLRALYGSDRNGGAELKKGRRFLAPPITPSTLRFRPPHDLSAMSSLCGSASGPHNWFRASAILPCCLVRSWGVDHLPVVSSSPSPIAFCDGNRIRAPRNISFARFHIDTISRLTGSPFAAA